MSTDNGQCDECGKAVRLSQPGVYFEISGYEEQRTGGGANKIAFRQRTGKVMCGGCAMKRKHGIAHGQGGLL